MNWYYAVGQQQQGPIDEAQLDALLASGQITQETLVWRDGLPNWQPLRTARPSPAAAAPAGALPPAGGPAAPGSGEVQCAECRGSFSRENTIQYGSVFVCAACKPVFLQRLREGAAAPATPGGMPDDPDELLRLIQERGYTIDIGRCFSRAWDLMKANFGLVVGTCFVSMAVQQLAGLLGLIPVLGTIFTLGLYGPFQGGLYGFFLKLIRGQPASVGDCFSGFSARFAQLMLTVLVPGLVGFGVFLIFALGFGFSGAVGLPGGGRGGAPASAALLILPLLMVPFVYLIVSWAFAIPLVMDKGMKFWPALEVSRKTVRGHWWSMFFLIFAEGLVMVAGMLVCFVGIFVAIPVASAMAAYAYEDIFGTGEALGQG